MNAEIRLPEFQREYGNAILRRFNFGLRLDFRCFSVANTESLPMLTEFDQNTLANMTAALESVCRTVPAEKDSHELRKQVGEAIIEAASSGSRSFVDLQAVGLKAVESILDKQGPGWLARIFGRKKLSRRRDSL